MSGEDFKKSSKKIILLQMRKLNKSIYQMHLLEMQDLKLTKIPIGLAYIVLIALILILALKNQ